jgi:cystathionine beta-lyase
MALRGKRHIPFATVSEKAAACSITFAAPSKTFNIAGVVSSYAVVPNAELRTPFYHWLTANELNQPTLFAPIATLAAFREGETWRREMLHYVEGNVDYVIDFCQRHLPEIRPLRPEASFLIWMDCRALGLSRKDLVALFVDKARLALNDGAIFGPGGEGFMRLNVGAPRATIVEAMTRLERAVRG